jgi:hypothetical protein
VRKTKNIMVCMAALVVLVTVQSAVAQGKVEGAWKVIEVTLTGPNARTIPVTQPNLYVFTEKHFSYAGIQSETPRPELPANATDAQKVATWTPFYANAGTYEIRGTTFTGHAIVSKDPNQMKEGSLGICDLKFEGKMLFVTFKATDAGPIANPYTMKLVRVE